MPEEYTQYSAPVAPDTSYNVWARSKGIAAGQTSGLAYWINSKLPSNQAQYQSWKAQKENEYNKALADWQTYMTLPQTQKALYEDAGFNSNYTNPGSIAAGSPGSYSLPESSGPGSDIMGFLGEALPMAIQMASGIQSLQMGAATLAGKKIENSFLSRILGAKGSILEHQGQAANLQVLKMLQELMGGVKTPDGSESATSQVLRWLNGVTGDLDVSKYPGGLDEAMMDYISKGPYAQKFSADVQNVLARTNKLSVDQQLAELKKVWQGNENDWQEFSKGMKNASAFISILMSIVSFIKMF